MPFVLALGGVSGSGKTTLIRELLRIFPGQFHLHLSYTTRPPREGEEEGVDYYFRTERDFLQAGQDPRFGEFVQARNAWYWIDKYDLFNSLINGGDAIHLFITTQAEEFLAKRILLPDLEWVWIEATERDVRERLIKRGDSDIESSLRHNAMLLKDSRIAELVTVRFSSIKGRADHLAEQFQQFASNRRNLWMRS